MDFFFALEKTWSFHFCIFVRKKCIGPFLNPNQGASHFLLNSIWPVSLRLGGHDEMRTSA